MPKNLFETICEEKLFSEIFAKHSKNLHDFIYYKYGEHVNPKDQVQEAFIKLWDNCNKVSLEKSKSFLFTVANNLSLNHLKHDKIKLKYQQLEALANLSEAQRVAFLLNRIEGKRHKEIAEFLGISRKAVEKRIYGALEKLRKDIDGI